jgi:ubiquinol-cytochrome c reductase cytochrome c subunit
MGTRALVCCLVLTAAAVNVVHGEHGPGALFNSRCRACHTFGAGDLVGPDLKGVTDRHTRDWLRRWITSSQSLVRSGDPAANALFNRFRRFPMPDQSFAPGELESLLDYFAAGGPEAEARRNRRAEQASAAEIELGRALFTGTRAPAVGGAPCMACHAVAGSGGGGNLGPDLTHAYSKFQDRRLGVLLSRGCFPRAPYLTAHARLSDDEVFALKAFLRHEDPGQAERAVVQPQAHR